MVWTPFLICHRKEEKKISNKPPSEGSLLPARGSDKHCSSWFRSLFLQSFVLRLHKSVVLAALWAALWAAAWAAGWAAVWAGSCTASCTASCTTSCLWTVIWSIRTILGAITQSSVCMWSFSCVCKTSFFSTLNFEKHTFCSDYTWFYRGPAERRDRSMSNWYLWRW